MVYFKIQFIQTSRHPLQTIEYQLNKHFTRYFLNFKSITGPIFFITGE
jgi:hypothetical protein